MSEHIEETPQSADESLLEKTAEKLHHDSSSDSDSDKPREAAASVKAKIYRLFGRERPVHHILGGGKPADVILWRNKKISAATLGIATAVWVLFELLDIIFSRHYVMPSSLPWLPFSFGPMPAPSSTRLHNGSQRLVDPFYSGKLLQFPDVILYSVCSAAHGASAL